MSKWLAYWNDETNEEFIMKTSTEDRLRNEYEIIDGVKIQVEGEAIFNSKKKAIEYMNDNGRWFCNGCEIWWTEDTVSKKAHDCESLYKPKIKTRLFRCTECGMVFGWVGISDPIDQLCGDCEEAYRRRV